MVVYYYSVLGANGGLNITHNFVPHGLLPMLHICIEAASLIDTLKCGTWVLARDTVVQNICVHILHTYIHTLSVVSVKKQCKFSFWLHNEYIFML